MNIPDGWTIEGRKAIGRFGEPYDIYSYGKPTGEKHWPLEVIVELDDNGNLEVSINDDNASYTSGSYTSATIPFAVLFELGVGNK